MAQLHSPACASCSACLRHPSPPSCCSHSQTWMNLTQQCLSRTLSSVSSGSWHDAIVQPCSRLECGIHCRPSPPDVLQCVQSTLQMSVYNLCQTTLNKFLQKNQPPLCLVQFPYTFQGRLSPSPISLSITRSRLFPAEQVPCVPPLHPWNWSGWEMLQQQVRGTHQPFPRVLYRERLDKKAAPSSTTHAQTKSSLSPVWRTRLFLLLSPPPTVPSTSNKGKLFF